MLGTIANALAVVAGSAVGMVARRKVPSRALELARDAVGLFTLSLGASMALERSNPIVLVFSLLLGALLGHLLKIEERLERLAPLLKGGSSFATGLMTAFLTYCVGPMTVVGSLKDGMGDPSILLTKSVMDGMVSVAYSATLGWGVMASAIPLLIFQGSLALIGWLMKTSLPSISVSTLTACGGILLLGVGVNLLNLRRVRVGDLLPALLFAALLPLAYNS
ncbi:MAG: DUF554 domain-containing protein [Thermofilaceae archaeon]|nr:DUF554 domain-containing protein [Thermofilaceae archaeon]MCX8179922.1 DUF554 domain-containing protein [Thermofilaceae archaeon]MDW8004387.1 DUF554 domain-containing protein [Thermofilaceae archaeon]